MAVSVRGGCLQMTLQLLPPLTGDVRLCFVCCYSGQFEDDDSAEKEDLKSNLAHGTRLRRKQFVKKLESAKVDMEADLKARAEEEKLALGLRERWQQKMRVCRLFVFVSTYVRTYVRTYEYFDLLLLFLH